MVSEVALLRTVYDYFFTLMTDSTARIHANNPALKEHFYITRKALVELNLSTEWLADLPTDRKAAVEKAEEQTETINRRLKELHGDKRVKLLPAQFQGMKLLHAAGHLIMSRLVARQSPEFLNDIETSTQTALEADGLSGYLHKFIDLFPPRDLFNASLTSEEYLADAPKRLGALEESLFVWLHNQNPALDQFSFLLTDENLRDDSSYKTVVQTFLDSLKGMGPIASGNIDPAELLTGPIRHAPNSLLEQLRYIRIHWKDLLLDTPLLDMLDNSISAIQDEDAWLFFEKTGQDQAKHGGFYEKQAQAPSFSDLGNEPENYSVDSSWMPEVVMIAKSTFVWLDQLSKTYRRPIHRLQDIPDRELDILAERGFTALWLIGLWERSPASQKIKQLQGNPEAKPSAYALDSYTIADELGGYEGYLDLRNRTMIRGIRLASDMVPNHTGLDSVLVKEKPDWFLSTHEPPYPAYSYNGPNLSSDPRYGIFIEDGYWNRSDAAVTFKRVDYENGDTRYLYHGNDGTTMPWNDTAQLNFLNPETREAVIQQILHVAKMFPVIRFDAAMVLVKRHIQRLWFPLHGHAAGIPSRSAWSMSMEEFNRSIPEEFWREVVDRIHAEAPDTLLLAEAFWMLEGYFVRTLGMHRVYNSAFMHMLKKEDNADYRYLIKNTLEFDAGILKRYVNFMNNPDEDTAIAQFGNGDKYFGVCAMMATMPGLPMFGHGQVEGFSEKYGMEYAKAYYDEHPDEELVKRHEREIFPILKKRALFAGVENFFLYDVFTPNGQVNENIFCYSNRLGEERAFVAYNNAWEHTSGYAKMSVGFKTGNGIEQRSLCEGLGFHDDSTFVIFRDHISKLEFIRRVSDLREKGMQVVLGGYQFNIFLDFREVHPSKLMPYDRLCTELDGAGIPSIDRAVLEMSLAPIHEQVARFCSEENLDALYDAVLEEKPEFLHESLSFFLETFAREFGKLVERPVAIPEGLLKRACSFVETAAGFSAMATLSTSTSELLDNLGFGEEKSPKFNHMILLYTLFHSLDRILGKNDLRKNGVIDDLLLEGPLSRVFNENYNLASLPVDQLADLFCSLLDTQMPVTNITAPEKFLANNLGILLEDNGHNHTDTFLNVSQQHAKRWFNASRFTQLSSWMAAVAILNGTGDREKETPLTDAELASWTESLKDINEEAFISGYECSTFVKAMGRFVIRDS